MFYLKALIDFRKKKESLAVSLRHLSLNNQVCNSIQLIANLFAEQIPLEYEIKTATVLILLNAAFY